MPVIEELLNGDAATLFVYKEKTEDELFLRDLKNKYPVDYKQLLSMFNRICQHGVIFDETKYKSLSGLIHEFKTNNVRVLSFKLPVLTPIEIVITGYFKKPKTSKLYKPPIERAERIAKEIIGLYETNKLKIIR